MNNEIDNQVIIYEDTNSQIVVDVSLRNDTVWLSQNQMTLLFNKSKKTISEHINNIFKEGELEKLAVVRKFRITANDGKSYDVNFYNLDIMISVGYRVKSKRGTAFRIWATKVLKEHLINGYSINQKRLQQKGLEELNKTIHLLKNTIEKNDLELKEAQGLLHVILNYSRTWSLLQGYDEDSLRPDMPASDETFILDFDEAKKAISILKKELLNKGEATELFGREKARELDGIIRNIYQTFGGDELIPSVAGKAAHLLYYIIKDHPFTDGNKRIGAFLFILFLSKNHALFKPNGELKINDNALVALALMTAKSDPKQKDTVTRLIITMLENQ